MAVELIKRASQYNSTHALLAEGLQRLEIPLIL